MSEEKKYEVLPGVELPDIKSIQAAASDFNVSGVNDIQFAAPKPVYSEEAAPLPKASAAELAELQSLGEEVAENEARVAEESRRRMEAIKHNAVKAPESLSDLINYNREKMSEEALKAAEEKIRKEEELKKAIEDKEREREERRILQQRLLEEARERAAAKRAAEKSAAESGEPKSVEKKEAPVEAKPAEEPAKVQKPAAAEEPAKVEKPAVAKAPAAEPDIKSRMEPTKTSIASVDETFDDFSDFFDDSKF